MSEMIKFGGKTGSGIAKPVHVSEEGNIVTVRKWSTMMHKAVDLQIRDTEVINTGTEKIDVSEYGMVSLRILNSHDQNITVYFYDDVNETSGSWLADSKGTFYTLTVPANANKMLVVTADELPFLNYIQKISFRINAASAPTSGMLRIWIAAKG